MLHFFQSKLFGKDLLTIDRRDFITRAGSLSVTPTFDDRWGYKRRGLRTREKKRKKNERKKNIKLSFVQPRDWRRLNERKGEKREVLNLEIKISIPWSKGCTVERKKNDAPRRRWCTVHAKWENLVDLNKKDNKEGLANLILVTTTSTSIFNALGGFFQLDFAESEITYRDSFAWISSTCHDRRICIPPSFESWSARRFPVLGTRSRINFKLKFRLFRVLENSFSNTSISILIKFGNF